jgi:hypothetical protein
MIYFDTEIDNYVIREFDEDSDSDDLTWHRDAEDRIIRSIKETDWMIQIEDQLPEVIINEIEIKSGVWHRLIKGTGDLTLKIIKENGKQ